MTVSFLVRFILVICLVSGSDVFASAQSTTVVSDDGVIETQGPLIRARMGFGDVADLPAAYASHVLVLDTSDDDHMKMVVSALSQTNVFSQITQCEKITLYGDALETFFERFSQENYDVVTISLAGYWEEEHDFAFLYAMARQFPHTHFVLSIGNQGEFNPHYVYPKVCEGLLESVKGQLTFAIWSQQCERMLVEKPSTLSYVPQDMSMPGFYAERSMMAPGELGDAAGSSFAAPRIAGCIARLKGGYGVTSNEAASLLHQSAHKGVGYTSLRYGSGCVNYAQAALLAASHTSSELSPSQTPDFGRFLTDYHTFQCLAASTNPSHFVMAFQSPQTHFMTYALHTQEEAQLCQIAIEDLSGMLDSLEKNYLEEKVTFDQFAHALLDSPLYHDYPGCASYLFLKHYQNVDEEGRPKEKDYQSCEAEAKELGDLLELASRSRSAGHLDLSMACLDRLPLHGVWAKAAPAYEETLLEYENNSDPVLKYWLDMGQCIGMYVYFDDAKIMQYFDDLMMHYIRQHGPIAGHQVPFGVIQRLAASLRMQLASTRAPGNPYFMLRLAKMYEVGSASMARDMEEAAAWYERILEVEDAPEATRDYAHMRLKEFSTRNAKAAFKYFADLAK